ncbi:MAG: helix-turn-helix domain-containing protein [Kiritimatiellia bacterium]
MQKSILKSFGVNVRRIHLKRGLTQEQLAESSGLHTNYIGGIERGERNLSLVNVIRLLNALHCRSSDLIPRTSVSSGPKAKSPKY